MFREIREVSHCTRKVGIDIRIQNRLQPSLFEVAGAPASHYGTGPTRHEADIGKCQAAPTMNARSGDNA